jgi:hypothetical protein
MQRKTNNANPYWRLANSSNELVEYGKLYQEPIIGKSCIVGLHYTKNVTKIISKTEDTILFKTDELVYKLQKQ